MDVRMVACIIHNEMQQRPGVPTRSCVLFNRRSSTLSGGAGQDTPSAGFWACVTRHKLSSTATHAHMHGDELSVRVRDIA